MTAKQKSPGEIMRAAVLAEMEENGLIPDAKEHVLLDAAAQIVDRIAALEAIIAVDGELIPGPGGAVRVHPAIAEHRQQAVALARVIGGIVVADTGGVRKDPVKQRAANRRWALDAERTRSV